MSHRIVHDSGDHLDDTRGHRRDAGRGESDAMRRESLGEACYTCHTDYTIYGDISAKVRGL
jgi:hypothetical protein